MENKYIKYLIFSLVIVITCIGVLNYIVDPLLYYQKVKRAFSPLYTEEQRFLIPGLIKNFPDHNAVIIGTSMAGIFRASEVSDLLKEKTIKLTINGATLLEQTYVLSRYLDAHPAAKTIIWIIDPMYIDIDPEIFTIRPYNYPFYLYDESKVNLQYLLNYSVTIHSIQTITSNLLGIKFYMKTNNLDEIHTWPLDTPVGCKQIMENYKKMSGQHVEVLDPILVPLTVFNKTNAAANLNKLLHLAESKKNVQFYLLLPPYSIVRYLFENEHNGLERILEARNFFADKTKEISNVKIIDLQAAEDIITNLDIYIDMIHHNRTITSRIIKNIVDENFDGYESILENSDKLRSLVGKYDFDELKKCQF
jgi:hypothetical protein